MRKINQAITVGIIEDDNKLRKILIDSLQLIGVEICFSFSSIEEMKMCKKKNSCPFIIFLDIGLPGISGLDAIGMIRSIYSGSYLVVISGNCDEKVIWTAITRGAQGYLVKPLSLQNIKQQIQSVIDGGVMISPVVGSLLIKKLQMEKSSVLKSFEQLTQREKEVVNYIIKGLTFKEVAQHMGVAMSTVNDFVKKIYRKMDVHSKTELVSLFV